MNNCMFDGRFVSDPSLETLNNGAKVVNFTLAINGMPRKDKEGNVKFDVDYFDFEIWDTAAEFVAKNCKKGNAIMVNCSAKQEKWTTEDGKNKSRIKFRVNNFKRIEYPKKEQNESLNVE